MDEITIGDKTYISSKQAAKITGYAKDYIGQLCREGRVEARLVGRNWYVLDSSIREHRFGVENEEKTPAKAQPVSSVEASSRVTSEWERPQYKAEVPSMVPTFVPKPAPTVAPAEMQSAWRQWFENKPQDTLPDGSDDFTEEYLPAVVPEEKPVEPVEETYSVPVVRVTEPEQPVYREEILQDERVELHKSYASRETGEVVPEASSMVVDLTHTEPNQKARVRKAKSPKPPRNQSNLVANAILLVVTLVAVLTAIVGTGYAEKLLSGTSVDFGAQKGIIDFLGGESTYKKAN
ncbi:MAG: hypothetical protein AB199_04235 [Parcubacteria bacterium C7867-004]|nr:MAG: hypothetical protein AB199_04235 [Parcubacteria bacterium C7867-004]